MVQGIPCPSGTKSGSAAPSSVLDALMPDRAGASRYEPSRALWQSSQGPQLQRLSSVYAGTYLMAGVLQKVDRASMMHSLEVRPFLDHRGVTQAARCHDSLRVKGTQTKALRRLAQQHLPEAIVKRPKKGFGIPLAAWLRGPLKDWSGELLDPALLRRHNLVRPVVEKLRNEHLSGKRNHAKILWNLCALSALRRRPRKLAQILVATLAVSLFVVIASEWQARRHRCQRRL